MCFGLSRAYEHKQVWHTHITAHTSHKPNHMHRHTHTPWEWERKSPYRTLVFRGRVPPPLPSPALLPAYTQFTEVRTGPPLREQRFWEAG